MCRYFTERLIRACAELPKMCEFFHIPFQSGDNDILRQMKCGACLLAFDFLHKHAVSSSLHTPCTPEQRCAAHAGAGTRMSATAASLTAFEGISRMQASAGTPLLAFQAGFPCTVAWVVTLRHRKLCDNVYSSCCGCLLRISMQQTIGYGAQHNLRRPPKRACRKYVTECAFHHVGHGQCCMHCSDHRRSSCKQRAQ